MNGVPTPERKQDCNRCMREKGLLSFQHSSEVLGWSLSLSRHWTLTWKQHKLGKNNCICTDVFHFLYISCIYAQRSKTVSWPPGITYFFSSGVFVRKWTVHLQICLFFLALWRSAEPEDSQHAEPTVRPRVYQRKKEASDRHVLFLGILNWICLP